MSVQCFSERTIGSRETDSPSGIWLVSCSWASAMLLNLNAKIQRAAKALFLYPAAIAFVSSRVSGSLRSSRWNDQCNALVASHCGGVAERQRGIVERFYWMDIA